MRLKVSLDLDHSLLDLDAAEAVQRLVYECLPSWRRGVVLWRSQREKVPVNFGMQGALSDVIHKVVVRRGPFSEQLVARFGRAPFERPLGSAEFRGPTNAVILVLHVDQSLFARAGTAWYRGNYLTFQVCRSNVGGVPADHWVTELMRRAAVALDPPYGFGARQAEYDAKNMILSHGRRAIGRDISRYLPGLYWLNYFGRPYVETIGAERLASCPGHAEKIGSGFLVSLARQSSTRASAEYRDQEQRTLEHLGRHYFFDRNEPDRPTVAPAFPGLSPDGTI